jgi:hypothetical protein
VTSPQQRTEIAYRISTNCTVLRHVLAPGTAVPYPEFTFTTKAFGAEMLAARSLGEGGINIHLWQCRRFGGIFCPVRDGAMKFLHCLAGKRAPRST